MRYLITYTDGYRATMAATNLDHARRMAYRAYPSGCVATIDRISTDAATGGAL